MCRTYGEHPDSLDPLDPQLGWQLFTNLDMSQAYQQIPLEESLHQHVVINTHRGSFSFTRLPSGVSSNPGIFQCVWDCILSAFQGVTVYLDDILVMGPTDKQHMPTLEIVLQ